MCDSALSTSSSQPHKTTGQDLHATLGPFASPFDSDVAFHVRIPTLLRVMALLRPTAASCRVGRKGYDSASTLANRSYHTMARRNSQCSLPTYQRHRIAILL